MDYKQFFSKISGKRIAVCGIGVSNTPLIEDFLDGGARVIVCDRRTREMVGPLADELEAKGAELRLGENYLKKILKWISFSAHRGMNYYLPELVKARENGIAVTSEMEVFFEVCPATIFAVTGSDGKNHNNNAYCKNA